MQDNKFGNDGLGLILVDVTHALLLINELMSVPSGDVMSSGHHDHSVHQGINATSKTPPSLSCQALL